MFIYTKCLDEVDAPIRDQEFQRTVRSRNLALRIRIGTDDRVMGSRV